MPRPSRKPNPASDFKVTVDGVGTFTFGYRKFADELAIQREYARLLDGVQPTAWMETLYGWLALLTVLTVTAPPGWDIEEMDPLDEDTYATLAKVNKALTEQERSFRRKPDATVAGQGPAAGEDDRVLVSGQVPTAAA